MKSSETTPIVRSYKDCLTHDGKLAIVIGKYVVLSKPLKGIEQINTEKKYAVILMTDQTHVFLEPLDSPQAIRGANEREKFNGKWVHVLGTINRTMPSSGQGLINPCITGVIFIHEHEQEDASR